MHIRVFIVSAFPGQPIRTPRGHGWMSREDVFWWEWHFKYGNFPLRDIGGGSNSTVVTSTAAHPAALHSLTTFTILSSPSPKSLLLPNLDRKWGFLCCSIDWTYFFCAAPDWCLGFEARCHMSAVQLAHLAFCTSRIWQDPLVSFPCLLLTTLPFFPAISQTFVLLLMFSCWQSTSCLLQCRWQSTDGWRLMHKNRLTQTQRLRGRSGHSKCDISHLFWTPNLFDYFRDKVRHAARRFIAILFENVVQSFQYGNNLKPTHLWS